MADNKKVWGVPEWERAVKAHYDESKKQYALYTEWFEKDRGRALRHMRNYRVEMSELQKLTKQRPPGATSPF